MSQLCVHREMKHLGSLESTQEAGVALGNASKTLLQIVVNGVVLVVPGIYSYKERHVRVTCCEKIKSLKPGSAGREISPSGYFG